MKNKFYKFLLLTFLIFCNVSMAQTFRFETSELELIDNGKLIYAKEGRAISNENNLEIDAKNFEYNKELKLLKAFNGSAILKIEKIRIDFQEMNYDELSSVLTAKGNVKIIDLKRQLEVTSEIVFFNKKKNLIESPSSSILKDKFKNNFETKTFEYNINKNILKVKNATFKDTQNNEFYFDLAFVNTSSNKLFGKDVEINLDNKSFNPNNEPRLKGNSVSLDNEITEITKGVFTTCKKRDECPPWQLSAEKIQHDKKKQIINYKNAWLKVYDVPVMYFPKFFHPDPTVERKSGFLIPSIQNSNNSNGYLSLPYYSVISNNKDATFTPRFYADDKFLVQTEYRQVNKNSKFSTDLSFYNEKDKNTKNHFFYQYNKELVFDYFDESEIDLKIQQTSNDTYLRRNKLTSPLITSYDVLETSFNLDLYSDDLSINSGLIVYEDLNKDKNDRYEFILPQIDLVKRFENTNLNGDLYLKSNNYVRNYQTNILEKTNVNDLIFNSNPKISNNGIYNNYDVIIKNVNSDSKNSKNFKKDENSYISSLFQFNSSLPLVKESEKYQNLLKPKLALKISPNYTKDISDNKDRIDINDIYSFNRISADDTVEGGVSLTYGNEFSILEKDNLKEIFQFKLANSIRLEENNDLPEANQLGEKTSDFFGEITYNFNDFLTTKYNASIKNNFDDITYENLVTEVSINNFVTTFDYINENNTVDKNSYLQNTTKFRFNDTNNIAFSTRRNKKTDLTEYYNLMYQYKNDCLAASVEYNKEYYNDRDINTEENIFFKLTIIPFGEASSPNLKK